MFYLHCTKKLLDRIMPDIAPPGDTDTLLGNWYATALFWKPQVALLVSERTLLPVLMPLAPAATGSVQYAKTANRSVVGILNEFLRQAEFWLAAYAYTKGDDDDLLAISVKLAGTPCSPLYKGPVSPDKALHELVTGARHAG